MVPSATSHHLSLSWPRFTKYMWSYGYNELRNIELQTVFKQFLTSPYRILIHGDFIPDVVMLPQLTQFTNPIMHMYHIPQWTIQNRNVPIYLCSDFCIAGYGTGAIWDLWIVSYETDELISTSRVWTNLNDRLFTKDISKYIFNPRPLRPKGYCRHLRLSVCPSVCLSVPIILVNTITQSVYPISPPNLLGGFNMALSWMVL